MTPSERGTLIHRIGDLIEQHAEELAIPEPLDNGKPLTVARAADVALAADLFHYMSGWATKIEGADAAIALAVSARPFEQAFDSLARGGTPMMVALPPDNYVKSPIFETVLRGINIKGSIVGTHRDVEDVFTLHALGRTQVLRETRPLEEVNEAFDDVLHAHNKAPRVVLTV